MIRGERWQRVKELLDRSLDLSPDDRRAYLEDSCAGDELLVRQVESLLAEQDRAGDFLERPIFDLGDAAGSDAAGSDATRSDATRFDAGRRIGPYQLIRRLGQGGMGTVYLARRADDEYQRRVAIKVIRSGPGSAQLPRRFLVERQILADLDHPNIAKLLDGGTINDGTGNGGLPYFVMEYVDGVIINEYCDRERLSVGARLDLFGEVCAAVQAAHRNLIVHRDIKPANILVTGDGPKLLDFGIAKPLDAAAFPQAVETTGFRPRPMTPIYASPEQIRGEAVTTATDVYSLGVVLYELLAGRHPYLPVASGSHSFSGIEDAILRQQAPRPSDTISGQREHDAGEQAAGGLGTEQISRRRGTTPRRLRRQLAGDLDNIVLMALRKDPDRRYPSVEQLSGDLRRHRLGLPVAARKDTAGYRLAKFVRRNRLAVTSAAVVATLVVAFAIAMAVLAARLQASDKEARGLADQAATLAEDLNIALDEKQQEEVRRKLAEATELSLLGKSEEAERLRDDIELARAELAARTRTLEELRHQLDRGGDASEGPEASSLGAMGSRLEATERQLEEARDRADRVAGERNAALDRATSKEQQLAVLSPQLADARDRIRVLESELAEQRNPAEQRAEEQNPAGKSGLPPDGGTCRPGEELEVRGFVFVRICAGTFTIGSPAGDSLAFEDEYPAHEVTLSEFWIAKLEVTNHQYRRWRADHSGEARLPVATVGWTQARRFCKHFGFELPTEAEWEYAARAGSRTRWFFGDSESDLDAYAWYQNNSGGEPHPVGRKRANAWGLHDMYGNVWEWVADMWAPYSPESVVDPTGPPVTPGARRMVRGGAFDDGPRLLRSATRGGTGSVFRRWDVGFRCARHPR